MSIDGLTECSRCGEPLVESRTGQTGICPACTVVLSEQELDLSSSKLPGASGDSVAQAALATGDHVPTADSTITGLALRTFGRFELRKVLGQGSFGKVYLAHDSLLERNVALKIPTFDSADQGLIARFLIEAKAAAGLRHPNIVPVYETGTVDGRYFIAAQFVAGQTLAKQLQTGGHSCRQAAQWAQALADALAYAHREGVIHRDIKPGNILLDEKQQPQILDFGLAKRINEQSSMTVDGTLLGTPAYMSPEQARGDQARVGPRSDQYSLGVVLYELLTGRRPFDGPPHVVMHKILTEEPLPIQQIRPDIPPDLAAICQKAISKEPSNRYPSAAEMSADLSRFLEGSTTIARPLNSLEQAWRWCRRNRVVAMLILAVLCSLSAGMTGTLVMAWRARAGEAQAIAEAQRADSERDAALRESALRTMERAAAYCENGELARGVLMFVESLRSAIQGKDEELEQAIRLNIAAWSRDLHEPAFMLVHPQPVDGVVCDRNGRLLTACRDGAVRVWSLDSGEPIGKEMKHPWPVRHLVLHPSKNLLLTGCDDGHARVWSLDTHEMVGPDLEHYAPTDLPRLQWPKRTGISSLAYSPDGQEIITSGWDAKIRFWEADSGKPSWPGPLNGVATGIAFTPDGDSFAASLPNKAIQFVDWKTRNNKGQPIGTGAWCYNLSMKPDGTRLVAGLLQSRDARRWNVKTGAKINPDLKHLDSVCFASYSPDGNQILTASIDGTAVLWDDNSGKPVGASLPHPAALTVCGFTSDGKTMITGCEDSVVRLWRVASGPVAAVLERKDANGSRSWVRAAALRGDGKQALTGAAHHDPAPNVWIHDLTSGQVLPQRFKTTHSAVGAAYAPDGSRVYVGDCQSGLIRVYDLVSYQEIASIPAGGEVWRLAISPDGTRLAASSNSYAKPPLDRAVQLFDTGTLKPIGALLEHQQQVLGIAFSPDSKTVLTGSHDRTTRFWNATSGEPAGEPHDHAAEVWAVAFHPTKAVIAVAGADRAIRLWTYPDWTAVGTSMQHNGEVSHVAFSCDGSLLLSGSTDQTGRLWHVGSGKPVGPALQHASTLYAAQWNADSTLVLTAADDGFAKVWRVPHAASGTPAVLFRQTERRTTLTMDRQGGIFNLSVEHWRSRLE